MGVYIKGMDKIPEDGAVLIVMHDNGKAYIKYACTYGYSMELVEVTEPHGRLIDVNDAKSRMIPLSFSVQKWIGEVELSNCNTVIEAEGE